MQTCHLIFDRAGPGISIQDMGRPNMAAMGLATGGAADRLALIESAALLGIASPIAAIEFMATAATVRFSAPTVVAFTGAKMTATIGTRQLAWNACHLIPANEPVALASIGAGSYSYMTPARTLVQPKILDSHATNRTAGIGDWIATGACFEFGDMLCDPARQMILPQNDRFGGGIVRYVSGPQSDLFTPEMFDRLNRTEFLVSRTANRQGVRLDFTGDPFGSDHAAGLVSDVIITGDIQMTGTGQPYVLLADCQTIGGYPRMGTIIPPDMPRLVQARAGDKIRFQHITLDQADIAMIDEKTQLRDSLKRCTPLIRDPSQIADLLSYQLIDGMITGTEE